MTVRRLAWFSLVVLVAGLLPQVSAPAQTPQPPTDTGVDVYRKVLRSSVWVHSDRGGGKLATGSGSLVDRGRRLILTNFHVVGDVKRATVFFPVFDGKRVIPERSYYRDRAAKLGIGGEVVELDKEADLALIRIDRVPDDVPQLSLAADSPDPGQTVHSIGNPGGSGALWIYTPGKVRQVYNKVWKARLDNADVKFDARVIETDSPTNPGDSGGPLVNDKGELVGVTEGTAVGAASLSIFIDRSEVRKLLTRRSVLALRTTTETDDKKDKEPPKSDRDKPVQGKDEGKFFSPEAWKKAEAGVEKLYKEKKTDLLIETYEKPPKGEVEKIKGMTGAEKEKFFRELALERVKAEKVRGIYVIICRNPTYLYVEMNLDVGLPPDLGSKVRQALISSFKDKKFDDGLAEAVKLVLDARGLGEKK